MDPTTATTVLLVLGSAFGVMFATMTTLLVVSIRVQHRRASKLVTTSPCRSRRPWARCDWNSTSVWTPASLNS